MPIAFVFPGQGSQAVGMGRDLAAAHAAARAVFEEVDDTLDQKLSRLMFDGPPETLQLTENTQPALMAHSMAALRVMETEGGFRLADRAVLVAGHSLGEYTALAAAGAFGVAQAAQLLRTRGTAMQAAVAVGEGAMAALIGTDLAQALEICAEAAASRTKPGRDGGARQRQRRGAGGDFGPQGGRRTRDRDRTRPRCEAGDAAAGVGPVPLRSDGSGRRGDGKGFGRIATAAARPAGRGQRDRDP